MKRKSEVVEGKDYDFQFRRFLIPYGMMSNWGLPTNLMTATLLAIWQYNPDEQFISER